MHPQILFFFIFFIFEYANLFFVKAKFLALAILLYIIPFCWPCTAVFANQTVFARVQSAGVFLYNNPIDEDQYKVFEIPTTYFVELLGHASDEEGLFYSARYMDVCGYVKKSLVAPVQGAPIKPFADEISFRVFALSGLDLKSTPQSDTPFNRIVSVPYLCNDLVFYGFCQGEQMIPEKSSVWYYCKYISSGGSYYGYLYSEFCDKLSLVSANTETLPAFEGPLFVQPDNVQNTGSASPAISNELKIFVIVAICLPCVFIVYLLFKPSKLVEDDGKKSKKKIKRIKRSEFYELED